MPGYHAEVSEPGAEPPVARRSFATLDGALDRVMWRKVDNPDLIGRIVTEAVSNAAPVVFFRAAALAICAASVVAGIEMPFAFASAARA